MINPVRSLHHVFGLNLLEVEKQILQINLVGQIQIEVFQVQKIEGRWYAFFNMPTDKFNEIQKAIAIGAQSRPAPELEDPKVKRKRGKKNGAPQKER